MVVCEMGEVIDGKALADEVLAEVKAEVEELRREYGIVAQLAVILVGEDPASKTYVRNKVKACEKTGVTSKEYYLPADTPQQKLLDLVEELNMDKRVHGILVQLPLPKQIDPAAVIDSIDPEKDVDCFQPFNIGRVALKRPVFMPATPGGIMEMLRRKNVPLEGKLAVVVGASNIVGKPLSLALMNEHATVIVCNKHTPDLKKMVLKGDLVFVAVGKPNLITADMIKPGAVVVDVGINRIQQDGKEKIVGDVDFEAVKEKASLITPVPGGVGPMTVAILLKNTALAAHNSLKRK